jgi:heat shock protein HslJ
MRKIIPIFSAAFLLLNITATSCLLKHGFSGNKQKHNNLAGTGVGTAGKDEISQTKDYTYIIDGHPVTLKNGKCETEMVHGNASKTVTAYLGNDAFGDLNGDGISDVAFILTQDQGGSGNFYYISAILSSESSFKGINAVFLGDRIAVKSATVKEGKLFVTYSDRRLTEPMSSEPTQEVTKILQVQNGKLLDINPTSPLTGRKWKWIKTVMNDDTSILPKKVNAFTIIFNEDGSLNGTTDCNRFFGNYSLPESKLSFGPFGSTKMFCLDSQEEIFLRTLKETERYLTDKENNLILLLKSDSGSMLFK